MLHRPLRRLRATPALRNLVKESYVAPEHLVYPIFVREGISRREPIEAMPGQFRFALEDLDELAASAKAAGIGGILVFGLPAKKDQAASGATSADGIVPQAVDRIKKAAPDLVVMTDVCVCAYTPHGHCGILNRHLIDNDATLPVLAEMALSHVRAGADIVAPSSMMDGQVLALRHALDENHFKEVSVMGYSAKFSSSFYGPFREAADSSPSFGDRASYQHDAANARHAERELLQDVEEGADILMVKPGLAYLDILLRARQITRLPLSIYCVSGEYSMVKAASERGWIDERKVVLETLLAFRRAGADFIMTYHALEAAKWLNDN